MKRMIIILFLIFSCVYSVTLNAQVRFRGALQSSAYGWEVTGDQRWDFYQGLNFRISPENYSSLYFNTYLRAAYRGDPAEWHERVYNMYANWDFMKNYKLSVGRQFLYNGVINGTVDAAMLSGRFMNRFLVKVLAGTDAPYSRELKLKEWDDGNVLGGYVSYYMPWQSSIEVSYFQKERSGDQYWQQVGTAVNGYVSGVNYYGRFDYNLKSSSYQMMRYRLTYLGQKWTGSAEYLSQKPRIYEDSFFSIFEVNAYDQVRVAGTYRLTDRYEVGLQYLHTIYTNDTDNRIAGTFGTPWGQVGVIREVGYSGLNLGFYGDLRYEVLPNLTARVFSNYYNYERAYTNISEDAFGFSGGLSYRFKNMLILQAEAQQMNNTYYEKDWRGLFRLTYLFKY